MDEKEINQYVKKNELNFIKSGDMWGRNQPISISQRNKISNITRGENIYPSLTDFLYKKIELSENSMYHYNTSAAIRFHLLSNDFMIICPTRHYVQNDTTNQNQHVTSVGVMYYRRTNYKVEKKGNLGLSKSIIDGKDDLFNLTK